MPKEIPTFCHRLTSICLLIPLPRTANVCQFPSGFFSSDMTVSEAGRIPATGLPESLLHGLVFSSLPSTAWCRPRKEAISISHAKQVMLLLKYTWAPAPDKYSSGGATCHKNDKGMSLYCADIWVRRPHGEFCRLVIRLLRGGSCRDP